MMEQFEKLNEALGKLEELLASVRSENDSLRREVGELKGIVEDRDLEILQLQEDAEKSAASAKAEKEEIGSCLEKLLGRMSGMASSEEKSNG